jgi:hypothetical protein
MRARMLSLLLVVPALALLFAPVAMAGAGGKQPQYDSDSSSRAGICLELLGIQDDLLEISCTESESSTDNSGATGRSEATPLEVLNLGIPGVTEAVCGPVAGAPGEGAQRVGQSVGVDGGSVELANASCSAKAVQENNADGRTAESTLLSVSGGQGGDSASLDVAQSEADSKTTSGSAHSDARFTAAEAQVNVQGNNASVTAVDCTSRSMANNGGSRTETSGSLVDAGGVQVEDPGLCALFVHSEASYTQTGP